MRKIRIKMIFMLLMVAAMAALAPSCGKSDAAPIFQLNGASS